MANAAKVGISKDGEATVFTVTPGGARRQTSLLMGGALSMPTTRTSSSPET